MKPSPGRRAPSAIPNEAQEASARQEGDEGRIQSVDALRVLIMIDMALDHIRDFFHAAATKEAAPRLVA
jgi:uncharacterized membrane protein